MIDRPEQSAATEQIRDIACGINHNELRDHNERLVLTLIQRHCDLAAVEIARLSQLSAQTVSVILRRLEEDGLISKGSPKKGKVGKPQRPVRLNPTGVYSWGVEIGRRSTTLVLLDFSGKPCHQVTQQYTYPTPENLTQFLHTELSSPPAAIATGARVAGIGFAEPFQIWNWLDLVGAPKSAMQRWQGYDLQESVVRFPDLAVQVGNDATLACNAEHVFGQGKRYSNYAYFYIGTFAGGGMVLADRIYGGQSGNAAAFGSIPVANYSQRNHQLIHHASIYLLEEKLSAAGFDASTALATKQWTGFEDILTVWIDHAAKHLAIACVSVLAVIDFEMVMIDGNFPAGIRKRLLAATQKHLEFVDTQGINPATICEGSIGPGACAIGAAYQPIVSNYFLNRSPTH